MTGKRKPAANKAAPAATRSAATSGENPEPPNRARSPKRARGAAAAVASSSSQHNDGGDDDVADAYVRVDERILKSQTEVIPAADIGKMSVVDLRVAVLARNRVRSQAVTHAASVCA